MKTNNEVLVYEVKETIYTDSRTVAIKFDKRHDNVLRKIDALAASQPDFTKRNFEVSEYLDNSGKSNKFYEMTEEGFAMIAMRFTGREAEKWQIEFISSFQKMRKELQRIKEQRLTFDWQEARDNGKCIRNILTSAISCLERTADKQGGEKLDAKGNNVGRNYYPTVTKMIYKELFGDGKLKDVRDKLDVMQLNFLTICEQACSDEINRLCELEIDYHDIYAEAKKLVIQVVDGLSRSRIESKPGSVVKLSWDQK